MDDGEACWCLVIGLAALLLGRLILQLEGPLLSTLWGLALILIGGVMTVLGIGVLLRLWR